MVDGESLIDYARGGSALEAIWIAAQQHGVGLHPVSPVFLYARNDPAWPSWRPTTCPRWRYCSSSSAT